MNSPARPKSAACAVGRKVSGLNYRYCCALETVGSPILMEFGSCNRSGQGMES